MHATVPRETEWSVLGSSELLARGASRDFRPRRHKRHAINAQVRPPRGKMGPRGPPKLGNAKSPPPGDFHEAPEKQTAAQRDLQETSRRKDALRKLPRCPRAQ
eukprot:5673868-Pyramimonas_sp.AAC.1